MKNKFLFGFIAAAVLSCQSGFAEETNAVVTDLNALISRVNVKIHQGAKTAKDYADELKDFDVLYAKYKDLKTEDVAQVYFMKAALYLEVLGDFDKDPEKAAEALQQVKKDMPETRSGQRAGDILDQLKKPVEMERIRNKLVEGTTFPGFNEKDTDGKPLSIAGHKGRIVLVDFWATWCQACLLELPNVLNVYGKYHDKGFDIIGVSLDVEQSTLERFIKESKITWPQYFDGKMWDNKLAAQYGVNIAPTTYLLDGDGKIIGKNLRGPALETAVAKALAKK